LDIERLREMLDSLLWEDGDTDIYRAKGLIHAADGSAFVLQAVGDVYELKRVGLWEPGNLKPSKLVFIGRGLERAALLGSLLGCRSGVDPRN
jgi:G3E family GTPase